MWTKLLLDIWPEEPNELASCCSAVEAAIDGFRLSELPINLSQSEGNQITSVYKNVRLALLSHLLILADID